MICPEPPPCTIQSIDGLPFVICCGLIGLMAESAFVLFLVGADAWDRLRTKESEEENPG